MSAPTLPPAAAWLESRHDRAQRLRAAYYRLERALSRTSDPHRRAAIYGHLERIAPALTRLGVHL